MQDAETARALTALDRDLIEQRVRGMYEARLKSAKDVTGLDFFSDQIVFEVVGNPRIHPFCGQRVGKAAMLAALKSIRVELEITKHVLHEIIIDGDRVAVRRTVHLRGRGTGRMYEVESLDRLRVQDGLIVEMEQFIDTEALSLATNKAAAR